MFGAFSGVLGFVVSMAMRLELTQAGDAFLGGNYQLYNVLVTSHAFLMIFFFVVVLAFFILRCEFREIGSTPEARNL